jgi:hypothetical protein
MNIYHTLNILGTISPNRELVKPYTLVHSIYQGTSPELKMMVKLLGKKIKITG